MLIKGIDRPTIKHWCENYHYAKRIPPVSFSYGWEVNGELQTILTIGKPASNPLCIGICGKDFSPFVYELNRICSKPTKNYLSEFVGAVLRDLPNLILVSYADTAMGHIGKIYQATNWIYTGATKARTDIKTVGHSRHYEKAESYPERVFRSSKHRYVFFTGDKKFKKTAKKELKYAIFPYPKGESKRYEIDFSE